MKIRIFADTHRWLMGFAIAYLALLPTNSATFPRSVAFVGAAVFAIVAFAQAWRDPVTRIPFAGPFVLVPLFVWALWSAASYGWSLKPRYTLLQLEREVLDSLLAMFVFYVAARDARDVRVLIATAFAAFVAYAALAVGMLAVHSTWDASLHHHGIGPYSTWVVLVAPLLLALAAQPPIGFGNGMRSVVLGAMLLVLMIVTARMTQNRMVWIALAAVFAVASLATALRWPQARRRFGLRWMMPMAALLVVLGLAFADALKERGQLHTPPQSEIATFEKDPRLHLWDSVREKIGARPWLGYGFGRAITAFDLSSALPDTTLAHAHNLFLSQWVQIGVVGAAAFVALLAALAWCYLRFLRSPDDQLAFAGVVGLALVAGFVVKNLTDDFLFRSNAKEFWALSAMLLGFGVRREATLRSGTRSSTHVERDSPRTKALHP